MLGNEHFGDISCLMGAGKCKFQGHFLSDHWGLAIKWNFLVHFQMDGS